MTYFKKAAALIPLLLFCQGLYAQNSDLQIPMTADRWEADPERVEFVMHRGVQAARTINEGGSLLLKDIEFTDGTIEFDVEMNDPSFVGIYFRVSDDYLSAENFYIRAFWPVSPQSRTTLQYATVFDGASTWDLTDDYQAAADIHREGWNHVKLVISGKQMKAYVNDLQTPAMHVPILEGETGSGGIGFDGNAVFANLVIHPGVTEGLPAVAGYDPTLNDSRYLRNWFVTEPRDFLFGRGLVVNLPNMPGEDVVYDLPDSTTQWTPIQPESRALVNLSRRFGLQISGERRLVWLKTTIESETVQQRRLDLGFSDEVWVFINGNLLHVDQNYFGTAGMKEPRGRSTIENSSIMLPLQEGENEILIGVANYFYGWGIIARLDDTDGLRF